MASDQEKGAKRSIVKNTLIYTIGNMTFLATQQILLIAIARLAPLHGLAATGEIGIFGAAKGICVPVFALATLNLRRVIALGMDTKYRFGEMLALRLITLIAGLVFVMGVSLNRPSNELLVIGLVALTTVFDSLSDLVYGVFQEKELMEKISTSFILKGVSQSVALTITYWLTGNLILACLAMTLLSLAVLLAYDIPTLRRLRQSSDTDLKLQPEFTGRRLWNIVHLAMPIAITMATSTLILNAPRYFVEHYLGKDELGVFTLYVSIMMILAQVQGAYGHAAAPRLAKLYATDFDGFVKNANRMLVAGIASMVLNIVFALLLGKWALHVLYGKIPYDEATFIWLMVGHGLYYIKAAACDVGAAAHYLKGQNSIHILSTLAAIGACWLWVPQFGLVGSAYGILFGRVLMTVAFLYIMFFVIYRHRPARVETST